MDRIKEESITRLTIRTISLWSTTCWISLEGRLTLLSHIPPRVRVVSTSIISHLETEERIRPLVYKGKTKMAVGNLHSDSGAKTRNSNTVPDNVWLQASSQTAGAISAGTLLRFNTPLSGTSNGTWSKDSSFAPSCFPAGTFPMGTCGSSAP